MWYNPFIIYKFFDILYKIYKENVMDAIVEFLRDLNIWTVAIRLVLATFVGGFIGLERGKQGRAAGMRTHILVCLGSALTMMIGIFVVELPYITSGDPTRIASQVVSGIGFLGVGSILIKGRFQITGLTTAAGLWATATAGLALGAGFYEGAIITFILAVLTVTIFHKIERKAQRRQTRFGIYVEIKDHSYVRDAINHLSSTYLASDIQVTAPRSGTSGNVGIEANIHNPNNCIAPAEMSIEIEKLDFVVFAIESI